MAKILVVDDEPAIRRTLKEILEFEKFKVEEASNGLECMVKLKKDKFDVILMDIKMPQMNGLDALERVQLLSSDTPVVMISGHGTIETAVEAVKKGAFDYISKPPDLNRLLITLRNAMDKSSLITEKRVLQKKVTKSKVQEIVGSAPAIAVIQNMIKTVGPTDSRVLVTGENGTGKELVARWLHEHSNRKDNLIVEVNCAAIPSELIDSELFGHEKGSFTSAHKQRIGKFELAHGGTLFLDEIGDMSLSAQAKVLRALQESKITRVGGEKDISVDVRVVAATNKNLKEEIRKGNFREDLYFRLAVILMEVPPLRNRREDIPTLVEHFVSQICGEYGIASKQVTKEAMVALKNLSWPGNIRELRNVVERLIILSGAQITDEDVLRFVTPSTPEDISRFQEIFDKFDNVEELHQYIEQEFSNYKGN